MLKNLRILSFALIFCGFALSSAQAEEACSKKAPKVSKAQNEQNQLAKDYAARRRGGDTRNCPCAGNSQEYCSCDSGRSGYYGYGYWHHDPYVSGAGWSRNSWGGGSDIPNSGYTPNAR